MRHSALFFDALGNPTQSLLDLLKLFGVEHNSKLGGITRAVQNAWYQNMKLRAEIAEQHGDKKDEAMPIFQKLGMVDEIRANRMKNHNCFLLGATVVAVRKRLAFLISEWERGVTWMSFVFFGSNRPLLAGKESPAVLMDTANPDLPCKEDWSMAREDLPQTEFDMMRMVYAQAKLPDGWIRDKAIFVQAVGKEGRNANTRDTLSVWGERQPDSTVLVSSQPFVSYQGIVAERVLPRGFEPECSGYAASSAIPVTTYLDNVAKVIFEVWQDKIV